MEPEIQLSLEAIKNREAGRIPLESEPLTIRAQSSWRRPLKGLDVLLRTFSPSERLFLYVCSIALAISAFILLANVNQAVSTEVPTRGGSLTEGAVGTPRFINPLLAASQTDEDLTALVYSGLLRAGNDGVYTPDIAESMDISADGTVYTFHLRPNLTFHDGTPLTSADVLFTVDLAQNPDTKSPRRADWEGVSASAPDARTVVFTLPHAYAPFRENATLGILPKALWENVSADEFAFSSLNTHPVGSGPYRATSVSLDATGAPNEYKLASFAKFALGEPNISKITYRTYANDDDLVAAYENGDIESLVASSPKNLSRGLQESADLKKISLARTFGVFLNQNHAPVLANAAVRKALTLAVDKNTIINQVLGGYGDALGGPIPPGLFSGEASSSVAAADPEAAKQALINGGWKFTATSSTTPVEQTGSTGQAPDGVWKKDKQELSLALATPDTEELVATAHAVADAWNAIGIQTSVQVYPLSEFNTTILRPRAYDAILFGEVVGRSLDLFAFWHSSQRNDPGLNLALYTSTAADKELALARAETDPKQREAYFQQFLAAIDSDRPAVFLYSPQLAYIVPSRIHGVDIGTLTVPSDRFNDVYRWYRDTERVWNIFSK